MYESMSIYYLFIYLFSDYKLKLIKLIVTINKNTPDEGPRTCILTKGVVVYSLRQFGDRNTTTVCLAFEAQNRENELLSPQYICLLRANYLLI